MDLRLRRTIFTIDWFAYHYRAGAPINLDFIKVRSETLWEGIMEAMPKDIQEFVDMDLPLPRNNWECHSDAPAGGDENYSYSIQEYKNGEWKFVKTLDGMPVRHCVHC